jgi:hypothetical protein
MSKTSVDQFCAFVRENTEHFVTLPANKSVPTVMDFHIMLSEKIILDDYNVKCTMPTLNSLDSIIRDYVVLMFTCAKHCSGCKDYSTNNVFDMLNTLLLSDILRLSMCVMHVDNVPSADVISLKLEIILKSFGLFSVCTKRSRYDDEAEPELKKSCISLATIAEAVSDVSEESTVVAETETVVEEEAQ